MRSSALRGRDVDLMWNGAGCCAGGSKLKDWDKPPGEDDVVPEGEVLEGFSDSEGFEDGAW